MELHELTPAEGSTKKRKRIARGPGSGHGGTSTRGHKGAKARAGNKRKRAFEGGQMPLQMRLPKIGFKSPNRVEFVTLNLDQIQALAEKYGILSFNVQTLSSKKVISKNDRIKVLGRGTLQTKVNVSTHAISESARTAIESLGGTVEIL